MEPRFVGYGEYQLFADAFEEDGVRQDGVGHQLLAELDLRLTGTERFHVQFRPLGKNNTGGSFYQFNSPSGYVDNATIEPQLYWFEMELASLGGAFFNPFRAWDINFAVGKVPYALHNDLLLKGEFLGIAMSKNNIYCGRLSNLNIQAIYSLNDLDAYDDADGRLYAAHANVDCRGYHELTTAFVEHPIDDARHRYYAAYSRTIQRGRCVLAARAMFKFGDSSGSGPGELYVLEANRTSHWDSKWMGIEQSAVYMTAYHATAGWTPISGGGFDRLRSSFSVNPLISIARQGALADNFGATLGVQLFRNGTDEHWVPELAFEQPGGVNVWGCGMRWLRKTSASSFVEVFGVLNLSDDPTFRREGIFAGHTWLF